MYFQRILKRLNHRVHLLNIVKEVNLNKSWHLSRFYSGLLSIFIFINSKRYVLFPQKDSWLQGHAPGAQEDPCHQSGPSLQGESKLKTWDILVSCCSRQHVLEVVRRSRKAGPPPAR